MSKIENTDSLNEYIMTNTNKAAKNSIWVIGTRIINLILEFVVGVLITRYLGAEQKGVIADANAISGLWGAIATFGLLDILISKFSTDREHSGEIFGTSVVLMSFGGVVSFIISIITAIILGKGNDVIFFVAVCSSKYLFCFFLVIDYWLLSNSESKLYAITQIIISFASMLVRVVGIILHYDVFFFVFVPAVTGIITYLSLVLCYRTTGCKFVGRISYNKVLSKELFSLALPMIIQGLAITIYMKVDQIMVGNMLGNKELGIYSVAVNLAESWYFIPTALYSSFLSVLARSEQASKEEFYSKIQMFADLLMSVGYIAVLLVMFLGKRGVLLLYGGEFVRMGDILRIYVWSGLLTCITYTSQVFFVINKNTRFIMATNITGAILNFVLNIFFINAFGAIGAALATVLEYFIVVFGQMIIFRKSYRKIYLVELKSLFPFWRMFKYFRNIITH